MSTVLPFKAHTFGDFLAHMFPPVELLLNPWLPRRGIAMIFGRAGVGKTILAQTTAYALATGGSFLGWRAPTPSRVLYVDGEMDPAELVQRFAAIHSANRTVGVANPTENLAIMTHADANGDLGIPDLADPASNTRDRIEETLGDRDILFLDNISALCRTGVENDAESWALMNDWLIGMRRRGKTTVLVHHAGKSGKQRGTSKREDPLNTILVLEDGKEGEGLNIRFIKNRGFVRPDPVPVQISWHHGQLALLRDQAGEDKIAELRRLLEEGFTQVEVAEKLGVSQSYVSENRGEAGSGKRGRKRATTVH
jgi:KaiC/GvpD/RAD55 family RecA-like ATPase